MMSGSYNSQRGHDPIRGETYWGYSCHHVLPRGAGQPDLVCPLDKNCTGKWLEFEEFGVTRCLTCDSRLYYTNAQLRALELIHLPLVGKHRPKPFRQE